MNREHITVHGLETRYKPLSITRYPSQPTPTTPIHELANKNKTIQHYRTTTRTDPPGPAARPHRPLPNLPNSLSPPHCTPFPKPPYGTAEHPVLHPGTYSASRGSQ